VSAERLDRRQLNRALLARQLLLERTEMSTIEAVEHLVGLQSQAPLAHYVALWSRLASFDPVAAGAALETRQLVRTHAMRATVHLFSRNDALGLRALTRPMLASRFASSPFPKLLPGINLDDVCRRGRELATDEAIGRVELGRRLSEWFPGAEQDALAYAVTYLEPMVQVPPRGVWGSRGPVRWQTFRGWLGADADEAARIDDVLLRYLGAFGPASVADLRTWSGLPGLRAVADRLGPRLRTFVDDSGHELLDLPDAPRPDPDIPAPARFLPEYDNVLLSHADRSRIIPDRRAVPLPPGDGARAGTVLVDGDFRATWRVEIRDDDARLTVHAVPALSGSEVGEVHEEAMRLLSFLAPSASTTDVVTAAPTN
jgi:Winged helix DNA-binding domain